jgi:hypothetical protein
VSNPATQVGSLSGWAKPLSANGEQQPRSTPALAWPPSSASESEAATAGTAIDAPDSGEAKVTPSPESGFRAIAGEAKLERARA